MRSVCLNNATSRKRRERQNILLEMTGMQSKQIKMGEERE